jgi:peptidoglycan biosynthesis protein MviN/MurJ (putative lipid II flippase)
VIAIYAFAIAVTLLVQVPVVAAFYPRERLRMAAVCAVTTVATNAVIDVAILRSATRYDALVLAGELAAVVVEALVYFYAARPRDLRRAFAASAAANVLSYAVGLLFTRPG